MGVDKILRFCKVVGYNFWCLKKFFSRILLVCCKVVTDIFCCHWDIDNRAMVDTIKSVEGSVPT